MKRSFQLILVSAGLVCLAISDLRAQNFSDFARMFSQKDIHGTARILGIGGAQTALGGDLGAASGNPAGLGFYTSSEFAVSPAMLFNNNTSRYLGTSTDDFKNQFNFASGGVVINRQQGTENASGFKGGSFGITVTRMGNFQNRVSYLGSNTVEDFIDYTVAEANAQGLNAYNDPDLLPELSFLAFQTTLIDRFFDVNSGDTTFFYDRNIYDIMDPDIVAFPSEQFPTLQSEIVNTRGAQYQTTIAYGANFSDKIYLGASLGITSLRYEQERIYREAPTESDLSEFTLVDDRILDGAGINGTVGLIYRPVNNVTMGLSYTSPTFYELEDQSALVLSAIYNTGTLDDEVVFLPLNFNLRTPGKLNGGLALFFENYGFITADVEWMDYGSGKISSNEFSFSDANSDIRSFASVVNFRVGAEFRHQIFRLRAGFAHHGDPLDKIDGIDRSKQSFTLGGGLRFQKYFVDAAYVHSSQDSGLNPYPGSNVALSETQTQNVVLTFGVRF